MKIQKSKELAAEIEVDLLNKYGPLLTGENLRVCLAYSSMAALRQAVSRGKAPVPIFTLEERRGKFALSKDVAIWMAEKRNEACD